MCLNFAGLRAIHEVTRSLTKMLAIVWCLPARSEPPVVVRTRSEFSITTMKDINNNRCSRCDGTIQTWDELTDEQREVVNRLPASTDYTARERQTMHRWCTRCWAESVKEEGDKA